MIRPACAGERQTVARVLHPERGEGWVVHDNGPSVFVALDDTATPLAWCGSGCSKGGGSYYMIREVGGAEAKVQKLEGGEKHDRVWSSLLGLGWLVWLVTTGAKAWSLRFEGDDGRATRFAAHAICVGTAEYARAHARSRAKFVPPTPEEQRWFTLTLVDGSTMAFRRDGAPPETTPAPAPADEQPALPFGGAR